MRAVAFAAVGLLLVPFSMRLSGYEFGLSLMLLIALVALTVIDLEQFRLPDALTYPLIALGIALVPPHTLIDIIERAVAALIAFALLYGVAEFYRWRRGRAGLGLGDAKLFAAGGAWLSVWALPSVLFLSAVFALGWVGLCYLRGQLVNGATRLAFGPYLAGAIWIVWMFGPVL
jgi:leader peptidase (prepilin peptidase) / N-methyltransferase